MPVTFFVDLPLTQVMVCLIVAFLFANEVGGVGVGIGVGTIVGAVVSFEGEAVGDGSGVEYLKFASLNCDARYGVNFS